MAEVTIGLIQSTFCSVDDSIRKIKDAADQGAQIICLQELFNTAYFCRTQNTENFDLAETIPGPLTDKLSTLAAELDVVLIVPMFEKRNSAVYHNSTAIIDADGTLLGTYRKTHIPQDPGFEEKFYFTPGDSGYRAWKTKYGTIGVLICWDQWFPEAARITAMKGAEIIFYPTAIGWLPEEKAEFGKAQHNAWEVVQRGHAVANGCYVAAVNRVGTEGKTEFWGQSFVSDFYGQIAAKADNSSDTILIYKCDLDAQSEFRKIWPFFRDRQLDSYDGIQKRMLD